MWTQLMDMHSGGGTKEKWEYIYIEASVEEAKLIFYNKFGHSPDRVSCTCCGNDYSCSEDETLEEATAYNRGCALVYKDKNGKEVPKEKAWTPGNKGLNKGYTSGYAEHGDKERSWETFCKFETYLKNKSILVIYKKNIKENDRQGTLPEQGYVWQD